MSIARFSVRNPVFVNLVMVGLFCFGAISLVSMPQELNPQIDFNWVIVSIPYPGASPEEVESLIVEPVEAEIHDLDKLDELQSSAAEGLALFLVKFEDMSESEFREIYTDLKARIDRVDLPEEAEDPDVDDFDSGDFLPILTVNMAYTIPEENAQIVAEDLEEDLKNISGVARSQVSGLPEREIWIEVDPTRLTARGLSVLDVVRALQARNLNVPGGTLTYRAKEYAIRSVAEYRSVEEIRETIVRAAPGGETVRIRDVARVRGPPRRAKGAFPAERRTFNHLLSVEDDRRQYERRHPGRQGNGQPLRGTGTGRNQLQLYRRQFRVHQPGDRCAPEQRNHRDDPHITRSMALSGVMERLPRDARHPDLVLHYLHSTELLPVTPSTGVRCSPW